MSTREPGYTLRATGPAERQLNRLPDGTAAAIVEFILGALLENPHRLGGALQRNLKARAPLDALRTASSSRSPTPSDS